MKIKALHLKNFRSIKEVNLEFKDITAIIGRNGSGKTTILEIIAALLSGRVIHDIPSDFAITIVLDIKRSEKDLEGLRMPIRASGLADYIELDSNVCTIKYNNLEHNLRHFNLFKKIFKHIAILSDVNKNMYLSNAEILKWRNTGFHLDVLDLSNSKKVLKAIHNYIHNEVYAVEQKKAGVAVILRIIEKLNTNLGIFNLKNFIQFDPEKGLLFTEKLLPYNKLASGFKKLVIMLLYLSSQVRLPGILLIDEPEVNLHIAWKSKLVQFLQTISPETQIIMATHDPIIIMSSPWGITLDGEDSKIYNKNSYNIDEIMHSVMGMPSIISKSKQSLLEIQDLLREGDLTTASKQLDKLLPTLDPNSLLGIDAHWTKRRLNEEN